MNGIVHPLADELGGLVEDDRHHPDNTELERDTSWRWMAASAVAVGVLAWLTR